MAGAAVADITPPIGIPMGGYGARQGVSTGILDPLLVRVLVLSDGETKLVLAVCDLVAVWPDMVERARQLVEDELSVPRGDVLVAATHTHSGPAGISVRADAEYAGITARTIAGAVRMALDSLTPVTLKAASADVATISQNRRHPDGPIETELTVLSAAPPGGEVVATLANHACHATVLEYDNLGDSADWPGASCRAIERAVGGRAIYLQGACGDINPVWMRHDHAEVERVGGVVGAAAARAVHELRPVGEGQWAVNLNWSEDTPKEPAAGTLLSDVSLVATTVHIDLPRRVLDSPEDIEAELARIQGALDGVGDDVGARRRLRPRLNQLTMERYPHAGRGRGLPGGRTERAEIQVMRIAAECALVALPGEFFVETGRQIRERLRADGIRHVLLAGYANGYLGYLPTEDQFPQCGYEVGCARFEPLAAAMVADAAVEAVLDLYR
jgi:neutral ceramidase